MRNVLLENPDRPKQQLQKRLAEPTRAELHCLRLYLLERQTCSAGKCQCVCSHSVISKLDQLKIHSHKSTSCATCWRSIHFQALRYVDTNLGNPRDIDT
jgi:MinD superfamily P-loop ATPase